MAQQVDLGLGYKDWARIAWTFVEGVLGYASAAYLGWIPGQTWDWKAFAVGGLMAGYAAVKNGVLADTSGLK